MTNSYPRRSPSKRHAKTTAIIRRRPVTCVYPDLGISQTDESAVYRAALPYRYTLFYNTQKSRYLKFRRASAPYWRDQALHTLVTFRRLSLRMWQCVKHSILSNYQVLKWIFFSSSMCVLCACASVAFFLSQRWRQDRHHRAAYRLKTKNRRFPIFWPMRVL